MSRIVDNHVDIVHTGAGWAPGSGAWSCAAGTSKGLYFLADDLPADPASRDDLLLRIMGSPDRRQIDGMGGAHPLTSKVAVVGPPPRRRAGRRRLPLPAGRSWTTPSSPTGRTAATSSPASRRSPSSAAWSHRRTPTRRPSASTWSTPAASPPPPCHSARAGPATTAPRPSPACPALPRAIRLDFEGLAGSSCGALLPTGQAVDEVDGFDGDAVDNGMPVVVLRAGDLGVTGYETCAELEAERRAAADTRAGPPGGRARS